MSDRIIGIETCFICNEPTGRAGKGDDSIYAENGDGPFCLACWKEQQAIKKHTKPASEATTGYLCKMDSVCMPESCAQWRMGGECANTGGECKYRLENVTAQQTGEPTVPGPYWVLFVSSGAKKIIDITEHDISNKAFGITILNNNYVFKFSSCKFIGPIQPPEGWDQ